VVDYNLSSILFLLSEQKSLPYFDHPNFIITSISTQISSVITLIRRIELPAGQQPQTPPLCATLPCSNFGISPLLISNLNVISHTPCKCSQLLQKVMCKRTPKKLQWNKLAQVSHLNFTSFFKEQLFPQIDLVSDICLN
jgi:hypothetical protein